MKKSLLFCAIISQLLTVVASSDGFAGVGGSGGGPRAVSHVSVEVCSDGPGKICASVTYIIRVDSPTTWSCHILQENASEVVCPPTKGIPIWLEKLNEAYQ